MIHVNGSGTEYMTAVMTQIDGQSVPLGFRTVSAPEKYMMLVEDGAAPSAQSALNCVVLQNALHFPNSRRAARSRSVSWSVSPAHGIRL